MKGKIVIPFSAEHILPTLGAQIKLARLRRRLSAALVAERAGISRATLWQIEKGASSVTVGAYFMALFALGLESDLLLVAKDDTLGRKLQDLALTTPKRAPRRKAREAQ